MCTHHVATRGSRHVATRHVATRSRVSVIVSKHARAPTHAHTSAGVLVCVYSALGVGVSARVLVCGRRRGRGRGRGRVRVCMVLSTDAVYLGPSATKSHSGCPLCLLLLLLPLFFYLALLIFHVLSPNTSSSPSMEIVTAQTRRPRNERSRLPKSKGETKAPWDHRCPRVHLL